jgi:serine/threonine protein kinase
MRLVAATVESMVGQPAVTDYLDFVNKVFEGEPAVSRPFPSLTLQPDEWGGMSAGVPTMFAAAPVRDDAGQVVAVLGFRIRPDKEFTEILNTARFGQTGEAYAFDGKGVFLSRSRFEDDLRNIGLMADTNKSRSVLSVELRDPGVDMTRGEKPTLRRSEQPLTEMAAAATQEKKKGVNAVGYRDYRGVPTVGAWTWLPDYGMGVAVEMDRDEVLRPVYIVRRVFWALMGLLAALTLGLLAFTLLAGRLEQRVREAVLAAGKLGQYALEEKIGEGGMGAVYKARHALLRRPTAVKLLEPKKTTELAVARFEREVQLTSQLNHPNTITIYDYGRTDEGVFYYAMEYLDGFSLQSLVERFGPQPDGRVIQILLQVCGSLLEAHTAGLMHRDIKPANIMITCRGGVRDFVKLLDFGLVKATDSRRETQLTAADSITGTPLYLPPECIQDPDQADARSDLYSLGGVGYFLLTGRPVFEAASVLEIIRRQVETPPQPISEIVRRPVSPELEKLLLSCLAKSPADRPQSAAIMAEALRTMQPLEPWTLDDAHQWWQAFQPSDTVASAPSNDTVTRQNVDTGATIGLTNYRSMDS